MRPNRSTEACTAASASARLVTSSLTADRSLDRPKALDTRPLSRPDATTAWPAASAALAKSTPMPRPAPVMNQTFLLLIPENVAPWRADVTSRARQSTCATRHAAERRRRTAPARVDPAELAKTHIG